MTIPFHEGQRWISDSEPELGLGSVEGVSRLTVSLLFGASGERREYAKDNAPLRRVRFHPGDTVKDREGRTLAITSVEERRGLIYYRGGKSEWCETALSDATFFNKPEERLFVGQVDAPETFELRVAALHHQHRRRQSPVRGFLGGRIDLIPHQLYIAAETSGRLLPRVLLADEVGLGKTIEACLILHRLILTGRARRVLILVPDSLVHQWLVEMLRRFNTWFHIFDERRCAAIETARPDANPFLEDQCVLASLRLFTGSERRVTQAAAAGWDVLVVDEAHHLGWTADSVSPEYAAVEALSGAAPGLLLLTATPEQLGIASHFARLRLLDPARFHDLGEFVRETESYRDVAREAAALDDPLAKADLLDRHGTGRVMFRNTRATISGFPKRDVRLCPLDPGEVGKTLLPALVKEFLADTAPDRDETPFTPDFSNDPRIGWVIDLLKALGQEKVLLLCRSRAKAEAIEEAIRPRFNVKMAVFHEGLSLVQRDRHAAWFAEEDGARLLTCSEIGSEGRNFQFAHHLVLFDLPIEPELLEQRIGRLDRIGQSFEIRLHVPYVRGSAQEVLARWYDLGLDSFRKNLHGGHELRERFAARIQELAGAFDRSGAGDALRLLIEETVVAREELTARLEQGRDRLLELNSFRPPVALELVEQIRAHDRDESLDSFMISVFDHFTVPVEEIARRTYQLGSSGVLADTFPGLPLSGLTVTCDRARALSREDIQFLTWDHPLVTGALDLILGSENGNSSFAWWPDPKTTALYLEAIYLLECVAPKPLHVDRFLPPTPLRVLVNHRGEDESGIAPASLRDVLERGDPAALQQPEIREDLLPGLLRRTNEIANARVPGVISAARRDMGARLDREIARLRELRKVNPSVRAEEIDLLVDQKTALDRHLEDARLRLDAIRLIQRGPR